MCIEAIPFQSIFLIFCTGTTPCCVHTTTDHRSTNSYRVVHVYRVPQVHKPQGCGVLVLNTIKNTGYHSIPGTRYHIRYHITVPLIQIIHTSHHTVHHHT